MSELYKHTVTEVCCQTLFWMCVCVCERAAELTARVPQMRMSAIGVMHHVYRNSMDHGLGLAWLMANRVKSDLSDITLHVTSIDIHWLCFSAEWHQYHRLTPLMKRLTVCLGLSCNWTHFNAGYFHALGSDIDPLWQQWWDDDCGFVEYMHSLCCRPTRWSLTRSLPQHIIVQ